MFCIRIIKATPTGLEPATFAVTGRRSKPTELRSHIPPRIPSELWSGVLQCNQTIVSVNRSLSENAPTGPSNRQTHQSHGQSVQPLKSFSRHIKRTPGMTSGSPPGLSIAVRRLSFPFRPAASPSGFHPESGRPPRGGDSVSPATVREWNCGTRPACPVRHTPGTAGETDIPGEY